MMLFHHTCTLTRYQFTGSLGGCILDTKEQWKELLKNSGTGEGNVYETLYEITVGILIMADSVSFIFLNPAPQEFDCPDCTKGGNSALYS